MQGKRDGIGNMEGRSVPPTTVSPLYHLYVTTASRLHQRQFLCLRGLYFFRRPSLFIIYFDWLQTPIFFKSLRSHGALSKFPHPPCGDILAISQLPLHPQRLDRSGSGAKRHVRCPAPKDRCDMHIGTRGVPSSPECILGGKWEEWLRK